MTTVPAPDPDLLNPALQYIRSKSHSDGVLPKVLKAARGVYRAQRRKPQLERVYTGWIERYIRFYPDTPVGALGQAHVDAFLSHLRAQSGETAAGVEEARTALRFLRVEVLRAY